MNHAKIIAGIVLAGSLLSGCASSGGSQADQANYDTAVADAKSSIKAAKSAHYEWRDSGKILKKAEKSAKAGDFETAIKLANQAKRQGDHAVVQSKDQAKAGPHS